MTNRPPATGVLPADAGLPARLRVVIVDDEPLSRRAMRQLLDVRADVEVVAECASAAEFAGRNNQTDVLFLDIEMPVRSGMDLARALADGGAADRGAGGGPPFVVFVTAHDEHAVPAFDTGAVDYLTKPVSPARLERALARLHERLHERVTAAVARHEHRLEAPLVRQVSAPVASSPEPPPTSLVARIGAREVILPVAAVTLLEADGVYTAVHVAGGRYLVRRSLDELECVLGPANFIRVHRSYVVRRSAVIEARLSGASRRRELVLTSGAIVPVSRRRWGAVSRALRASAG